jgi:hypothetical protein
VLLQIVPYYFRELDSLAEIDDAIFVTARRATLIDRERTKLMSRLRYRELMQGKSLNLRLNTPKGIIDSGFDLDLRPAPIPHAFALASVNAW